MQILSHSQIYHILFLSNICNLLVSEKENATLRDFGLVNVFGRLDKNLRLIY